MSKYIKSVFTKNGGEPALGLFPSVTVSNVSTGDVIINNAPMSEVGNGAYKYLFSAFNSAIDYHIICNANNRSLDGKGFAYGGNDLFSDDFAEMIVNKIDEDMNFDETFALYPGE